MSDGGAPYVAGEKGGLGTRATASGQECIMGQDAVADVTVDGSMKMQPLRSRPGTGSGFTSISRSSPSRSSPSRSPPIQVFQPVLLARLQGEKASSFMALGIPIVKCRKVGAAAEETVRD